MKCTQWIYIVSHKEELWHTFLHWNLVEIDGSVGENHSETLGRPSVRTFWLGREMTIWCILCFLLNPTFSTMKSPLATFVVASVFYDSVGGVSGSWVWNQDEDSLLGDAPVPTLPPLLSDNIYPYLSPFPVRLGVPGRSKAKTSHSGRLDIDYRQTVRTRACTFCSLKSKSGIDQTFFSH